MRRRTEQSLCEYTLTGKFSQSYGRPYSVRLRDEPLKLIREKGTGHYGRRP